MSSLATERVLSVHHWNESSSASAPPATPGCASERQFVMIGLDVGGKPLTRRLQHRQPQLGAPRVLQHQGTRTAR